MTRSLGPLIALLTVLMILSAGCAQTVSAQLDGPHVYWTLPINTNIVGLTAVRGSANAAWANFNRVEPSVRIDNSLYLLSYSRSFGLFGRSAMATLLGSAGSISTTTSLPPGTPVGDDYIQGVADPSLGFWINLFGSADQPVREFIRYEQGTSVHLSLMGTFPVGQYDESALLNMGGNHWKVRLGLPIVQGIGAWVPGSRTTLEILPTMTIVGDNADALGATVDQDPSYAVEIHLTRDFTRRAFISLDYSYLRLGGSTYMDNASGATVQSSGATTAHLAGATLGYEVNDNLRLFVTHMQTASEDMGSFELSGEVLKVMLSYSWHAVLERVSVLN